jgi:hypothetical protein
MKTIRRVLIGVLLLLLVTSSIVEVFSRTPAWGLTFLLSFFAVLAWSIGTLEAEPDLTRVALCLEFVCFLFVLIGQASF